VPCNKTLLTRLSFLDFIFFRRVLIVVFFLLGDFPASNKTLLTRSCFLDFIFFRRVLIVVFFLLGDFPASEFYMPTFRNTVSSIFIGGIPKITQKERIQECVCCVLFFGGGRDSPAY
jgi:uncharacterized membrane protein